MRNFMWVLGKVQYALAVVFIAVAVGSAMLHYQFYDEFVTEYVPMADKIPTGPIAIAVLVVIGLVLMRFNLGEMLYKRMPKKAQPAQPTQVEQAVETESSQADQATDDELEQEDASNAEDDSKPVKKYWFGRLGKITAWVSTPIIGVSLVGIMIALVFSFTGKFALSMGIAFVSASVLIVAGFLFYYFVWTILVRWLADQDLFFLRVPEMTAAFVERDLQLYRIYVNAGERRKHFRQLAVHKNKEFKYERMIVLSENQQVVWIGLPWINRLSDPFYEHSDDARKKALEPRQFLDLAMRTIDYFPEGDKDAEGEIIGVVPNVDTADPIQVKAQLVVEGWVWDPETAVYGVQNYLEAVQKEIVSRWRRVVSDLSYFMSRRGLKKQIKDQTEIGTQTIEQLEINPGIHHEAYARLNEDVLGIGCMMPPKTKKPEIEDEDDCTRQFHPCSPGFVQKYDTKGNLVSSTLVYGEDDGHVFDKHSPARRCLDTFGFQLFGVEIRDLDPFDDDVRKAIQGKSTAMAKAAATIQFELGDRRAQQLRGEGNKMRRVEEATGEKEALKLTGEGNALALGSQARTLKKEPDAYAILAAKTAVEVAAGTELVVTEGGLPGTAGTLAKVMQAVRETVPATAAAITSDDVEE